MNTLRPPVPPALIVNGCPSTADSLAVLLRRWGFRAAVAHDGPSALALASAEAPAVALLDLEMPGTDGCELAGRLRRLPGLRRAFLIAITGRRREEDIRRYFGAGFDRHLRKPCDPEELRRALDRRLAPSGSAHLSRPAAPDGPSRGPSTSEGPGPSITN